LKAAPTRLPATNAQTECVSQAIKTIKASEIRLDAISNRVSWAIPKRRLYSAMLGDANPPITAENPMTGSKNAISGFR